MLTRYRVVEGFPSLCAHVVGLQLPLGKLSKATILQGFSVLKVLSEVLDHPGGPESTTRGGFQNACEQLSGDYYSCVIYSDSLGSRLNLNL